VRARIHHLARRVAVGPETRGVTDSRSERWV
jgi:hypothetical protein